MITSLSRIMRINRFAGRGGVALVLLLAPAWVDAQSLSFSFSGQASNCDTIRVTNRFVNTGGVLSGLFITNDLPSASFAFVPESAEISLPTGQVLTGVDADPDVNNNSTNLVWDFSAVATPSGIQYPLITEVYFNFTPPPGGVKEHYEWFEIYNPSTNDITLDGWSVQDTAPGQVDALPTFTIQPGEFAIIAGRTNAFLELYPTYSNQLYEVADGTIGSGLNTFGDGVRLRNASDTVIDQVSYGASTLAFSPSVPVPASGSSIERNPANNDTNSRNDWSAQPTPNPGSGTLPTGLQNGDVITIAYDVEINCDAVSGQFFARAGYEQPPGAPQTLSGSSILTVNNPDLVITKTPIATEAGIDDEVVWTVRVENAGFGVAQNVQVFDRLGHGMEFLGFSVPPTTLTASNAVWDATAIPELAGLAAQDAVSIIVTARVVSCSGLFNRADASFGCTELEVLPNEICEDTRLNNETATAGIQFIDRFPSLRGSIDPSPIPVGYCGGTEVTLHLTNAVGPSVGPAENITYTAMLPTGWSIVGDNVTGNVIDIGHLVAGATTNVTFTIETGGDCPISLANQFLYFAANYTDACGNPFVGPLLFATGFVDNTPNASVTKIMPTALDGDAGPFEVRVEFTYDGFAGTELITLVDTFDLNANLSIQNISAGGSLAGNTITWADLTTGNASGVLTTSFEVVIADACDASLGQILQNEIEATIASDCQGCPITVSGSGDTFPILISPAPDCDFDVDCGFASTISVNPGSPTVGDPTTITRTFTDFEDITDWTEMTFASDLAGGAGTIDSVNDVTVTINGDDVTASVVITSIDPTLQIDLSGLNGSAYPDPTAITDLVIEWVLTVDTVGTRIDESTLDAPTCGEQIRYAYWDVEEDDDDDGDDSDFPDPDACLFSSSKTVSTNRVGICESVLLTHTFTNFTGTVGDWNGVVFTSNLANTQGYLFDVADVRLTIDGSNVTTFVTIDQQSPLLVIDLEGLNTTIFGDPDAITELVIEWTVGVDSPGSYTDLSTLTLPACGSETRSASWAVGESALDITLDPVFIAEACGPSDGQINLFFTGGSGGVQFPVYDVQVFLDLDHDGDSSTPFEYIAGSTVFVNLRDPDGAVIDPVEPVLDGNQLRWDVGALGTNENIAIQYRLRSGCSPDPDNETRAEVRYNTLCDDGEAVRVENAFSQINGAPLFATGTLFNNLQPELQFLTGTQIVNQVVVLNTCAVSAYNLLVEMVLPTNVVFGSADITPTTVTATNIIWDFTTLAGPFGPLDDYNEDGFFDDLVAGETLLFNVTNFLTSCAPENEILIRTSFGCGDDFCQTAPDSVAAFESISGSLVTRATFPVQSAVCSESTVEYSVRNSGLTIDYDVEAFQVLPVGMAYVSGSSLVAINGVTNSLADPPGDGSVGDPLTWTPAQIPALAAMQPNDEISILYNVAVSCDSQAGDGQFISSGSFTDVCGNVITNRDVISVLAPLQPSLQVNKTQAIDIGDIGQTNVYTITINHAGSSEADVPYLRLTDTLPGSIEFLGASVTPDVIAGQTLVWSNDTLNALTGDTLPPFEMSEGPITIIVTGRVVSCAANVENTATVNYGCSVDDACQTATGNISMITNPRLTPPGLESQMTLDTCGGTKTVAVTNTGATAHGLVYTEWAPPGYIFVSADVSGEFNGTNVLVTYSGTPLGSVAEIDFTDETTSEAYDVKDDRGDGIANLDLGQLSGFTVVWTLVSAGENLDCLADPTLGNFVDPKQGNPTSLSSSNRIEFINLCDEPGTALGNNDAFPDIPNLDVAIIPTSLIVTNSEVVNFRVVVRNNSETTDADGIHVRLSIGSGWTDVTFLSSNIVSSGTTTLLTDNNGDAEWMFDFPGVVLNPLGDIIELFMSAEASANGDPLTMLAEVVGDCGNALIIPQCTFTNVFGASPLADTLTGGSLGPVNGQYSSFDQDRFNASGHTLSKTVRLDDEAAGAAGTNRFARVGEELIYRIEATYFGGTYNNVTITDSLPGEMVFGTPFDYNFTGGLTNAVWDADTGVFTFQPDEITTHPFSFRVDIPVTVTNRIDVQNGLTITNVAITAFTLDGVTNTPLERLTIVDVLEPNLQIVKTVNSNLVQAGDIIIFTNSLSHTPASSTTAYDIVFFDELPPGLVFNSFIQPATGNASVGGVTVEFTTNHWPALEAFEVGDPDLEFVFEVLVEDQIIGAPIVNRSFATYKSLDADSINGNERTGDDGVDGELNDYATASEVVLFSEAIREISKIFISSTQTNTLANGTTNDFTIGERFIYEIRVDVPQGIATNVVITDQVPSGWDWVGGNANAGLAFPGRGYEFFSPAGGPQFPTNVTAGLVINDPDASPDDSLTGAGSGQWITFTIPAVTNVADANLANDYFTLQLEFVALDLPGNVGLQPNPTLGTNVVTVQDTYIALGATSTPYRIVEHDIGVTKTRSPATADAGDTMTFTLTVTNSVNALANAYNILVTDTLDAGLYELGTLNTPLVPAGWQVALVGDEYQFSTIDDAALEPGEAVTVTFTIELSQAVRPNDTYSNTVDVEESSTLYDDPPGGITDRQDTDDDIVTFDIPGLAIAKILDSTSETEAPDSTGSNVQIGEVITYRLDITLPESTITNLTIVDTISNNGLAYVGESATVDSAGFVGSLGTLTETPVLGADVLSAMGQQMTFVFTGDTVVTGGPGTSDNSFSLLLDYLVLDDPANQDGTVHTNFATITYVGNPGNVVTSAVVTTTVVEPDVAITKSVDPFESLDAGDVIGVTLVITNTGTASAYDIVIEDLLDEPFFDISTIANIVLPTGFTSVVDGVAFRIHSDATATPAERALEPDEGETFTFDITLSQALPPNAVFTNVATVAYDSLDDNNIWDEQREYGDDDEAVLSGSDFSIAKVLWETSEVIVPPDSDDADVQIGEILTYRIAVTVPEGTITNLTLVDTLAPAGLAYIGQSAQTDTGGFDGTLGTLVESPLLAVDELSASGQQMTFTFEGNTIADATDGTLNNTFFLLLDYLVLDEPVNSGLLGSQTIHTNIVSVTYDGNPGDPVVSGPVTNTVIEPVLNISKTFNTNLVDAGDIVTVTLVVTNNGTATAYDVEIADDVSQFGGVFATLANITPATGFEYVADDPFVRFRSDAVAAEADRVIQAGEAKTFSFDVTISDAVAPNVIYTNIATVVGDSLSSTNIFDVERSTEDDDVDTLEALDFDFLKELIATSETGPVDSTNSFVQIGEVATYRLTAALPEGTITDLTVVDFVPAGMAYVVGSVAVDTTDFEGTLPAANVTPNVGVLGASGQDVTIVFTGDTEVTGSVGSADNIIRITLDLITLDEVGNSGLAPQTVLTNIASITYSGNPADPAESDPVTVTVVEPELVITKTVSPDSGDAGDTITVTLVLTNSGTATAYDLDVTDDLPGSMFDITTINSVTLPDGYLFSVVTNAPNATVRYLSDSGSGQPTNALPIAESLTFVFEVDLSQAVTPGLGFTNLAEFVTDTIDGTNVFDVDREYDVDDTDPLSVDEMDIVKARIATSETGPADSTDADVQIGEVVAYRLTVTLPESTIEDLVVVDVVPAGLQYIPASASVDAAGFVGTLPAVTVNTLGGPGDNIEFLFAGTTTVDGDNDPGNNSFTIDFDLLVLDVASNTGTVAGAQTILPNFATIAFDGNPPADTSLVVNVEVVEPFLAIEKSLSEASNNVVFVDIVITNSGTATAYDISITDALPALWWDTTTVVADTTPDGFTFDVTGAPGDALVTYASDPLSGQPTNTLVAGEALLFRFSLELAENAPAPLTNVAVATYTSIEGDGPEDEEREYGPIEDDDILVFPGVSLDKTLISPLGRAAAVGETVVFEIEVTNIGGLELDPVEVTDLFDTTYLSFLSAVPPQDDVTGGTITWNNVGPLDIGVSTTLVVNFEAFLSTKPGDTTNVVEMSSFTTNGVPLRPLTNDAPVAISNPGYIMTKTRNLPVPGEVASPGDPVQFTIDIVNTGDVTLVSVPLVDAYDTAYLTYNSAVPAPSFAVPGTIIWLNVGPLDGGASTSLVVNFTALASTLGGPATNLVETAPTVPPGEPPVPPSTNTAPYQISVPGYTLEKTNIDPGPTNAVQVGDLIEFQITITNTGDVELVTVPVEDTFDATLLSFFSATPEETATGVGEVTWANIGPLAAGASTNIFAQFTALQSTAGLAETNTVSTAPETPPGFPPVPPATNDAPYRVSQAGYTLVKTNEDPGPANAAQVGDQITFQITITNTGDVELVTVPVEDTFDPALLDFVSATPAESSDGVGVVNWANIGPLPVGQSTNITAIFTALQSTLGLAETNTVSTAPTTPPDEPEVPPSTNDAPFRVSSAGYTLDKTNIDPGATNSVAVGDTITFQITVTNTGDVELVTVPVEDTFDATYLAFASAVPAESGTGAGSVSWADIGPLPVGQATNIQVVFTTVASTVGLSETNTVTTAPTTPPEAPPVPPLTNDAPYRITSPGYTLTKTLESPAGRPALVGEAVQFSLTVANTGDVQIVTLALADDYDPAYLIYVDAVPASDTASPGNIQWTDIGPLNAGASTSVVVNFIALAPIAGETNTVVATPTTPPEDPDLPPLEDDAPYEITQPSALGNYVWLDENSDGYQDAGEPGIPNVRVNLYDSNGDLFASTVTDTDGGYLFTELPPGTYYVDVEDGVDGTPYSLPFADMTQTTTYTLPDADFGNQDHGTTTIPTTALTGYSVTLAAGEINQTADFGYNYSSTDEVVNDFGLGAIGDRVWFDANGDGVQDAGEPGIPGVWVELFYDSDGDGDYSAPYTVGGYDSLQQTDANGNYMFTDLPPGAYAVRILPLNFNSGQPLNGHTQTGDPDYFGTTGPTQDNQTTMPIILAPGDVFLNADFGYQPPASRNNSVGDTVWFDVNADGLQDPGEPGIAGVTVTLVRDVAGNGEWSPGDPIIATTTTDENGEYLFTGVPDGNYLVWVNDVNGVLIGLSQTYDSDGIGTPNISAVALDPTDTDPNPVVDLDQDFGYTVLGHTTGDGMIGDRVWLDINSDGVQDPNEPGIPGLTVELYAADGVTLLATTTTGADGYYYFGGLDPDTYTVIVTPPAGLTQTYDADGLGTPHESIVTIGGMEPMINLDQDFGYVGTGTIGNFVWEDRNANGEVDGDEATRGIEGVTLALYLDRDGTGTVSPGDPLMGTTVTDVNGAYLFEGLPTDLGGGDANYVVVVTDENGELNGYWKSSGPTPGVNDNSQSDPYAVTLTPGAPDNLTADFGYYVDAAAVGNRVWFDVDGDGVQDPGEPGIPDVLLKLYAIYPSGTTNIIYTVTDADGFYSFGNLLLDEHQNGDNAESPTYVVSVINPNKPAHPNHTHRFGGAAYEDSDRPEGVFAITWQGQTDVSANPTLSDEPGPAWYDFGFTLQPTLAVISAVRARVEDGAAVIAWQVELELDTAGYDLERWVEDEWVRVNESLIPALFFLPAPKTYEQVDADVPLTGTQRYRIIEQDTQGSRRVFGPYELAIDGGESSYETWAAGIDWGDADAGADADPDGDGLTNREEYLAGTDPLNPNSVLRVSAIEPLTDGVRLTWQSVSGRVYVVEMALSLDETFWPVSDTIDGDPPENQFVVPVDPELARDAFFRVLIEEQP
jgi:uncharacterized repeat protein (TIGR01451 family)/fimbrial isopeptide formation D2 family protein